MSTLTVPAVVLAALLLAASVWLVVPPEATGRTARRREPPGWMVPRDGAPGPRLRRAAGLLAGLGVVVAVPWPPVVVVPVGAVIGVVVWWGSGRLESSSHRRTEQMRTAGMPEALMMLASAMVAGVPLRAAVGTVADALDGPCAADLRLVASRTAAGVPDSGAWLGLAEITAWQDVARDVARAVDSGEGIAELLAAHAVQLRLAAEETAEKRARKAGVDAIGPLVCCHLPAFLLVGVVPIVAGMVMGSM